MIKTLNKLFRKPMKHLLIILSILLLSYPVIGQSSKYESVSQCVLQTMENRELTGNKMFEMVGEECKRNQGSYKKESENTKKGVLYYRKENGDWNWFETGDKKLDEKYSGKIKNGQPNGEGVLMWPTGDFAGQWKNGIRHGTGVQKEMWSVENDLSPLNGYTMSRGYWRDGKLFKGVMESSIDSSKLDDTGTDKWTLVLRYTIEEGVIKEFNSSSSSTKLQLKKP
jgi:hypothetical protein